MYPFSLWTRVTCTNTMLKSHDNFLCTVFRQNAGLSGRAVWGVGLRPLACWGCGFKSHGGRMDVCCECCVLSGRGLCDELIICPEESYRLWCVVVCDQEISRMRRLWPALGRSTTPPPPPKKKQCAGDQGIEIQFPAGETDFYLSQSIQTGFRALPTYCSMGR